MSTSRRVLAFEDNGNLRAETVVRCMLANNLALTQRHSLTQLAALNHYLLAVPFFFMFRLFIGAFVEEFDLEGNRLT